ncbi:MULTISPECIES: Ldh family oxidoreductase [Chelativorans]|uniref:Malate/L-lactate dehydrogenase n=1 Tax=Chelativorans sp. (strain BNC1) TaxID=266779 RepID=Q11CF6_CHESB|nr:MULTISPECIES: Ldh family oxidoreductase [Chelativorans]
MSTTTNPQATRYRAEDLEALARGLFERAGMPAEKASDVAAVLVEGDLFGKSTHGLALLPLYLRDIEAGGMTLDGDPEVLNDLGACLTWDGRKLPGPWLLRRATAEALSRAKRFGLGAVAIQRSHHTACLGAYLEPAVAAGCMVLVTLTDPGHSSVAPFGGVTPVLTSNPIAFGAPSPDRPILIDMSTALMTNGGVAAYRQRGEALPHPFLMDAQGKPSTDPNIIAADPPGTILPLGGLEAGHKGFSIGLIVELLTGCLSGRGRAEGDDGWSAAVFVLVVDPAAFGGEEDFQRQVAALVDLCHGSALRPGFNHVDLPGAQAFSRREGQRRDGVLLSPGIVAGLAESASRFGLTMPAAVS